MSNMRSVYGTSKKDNYSLKIKMKSGILFLWFVILTFICLLPIYILVVNATRESTAIANSTSFIPSHYFGQNLNTLLKNVTYSSVFNVWIGYRNSAIITGFSTIFTVFFSALTAYGLHVYDFKIKEAAYTIILLVMMVPVQVTSAGFVDFMLKLKLTDSYIPLIFPSIAAPAVVYFMRSYMKSSFPLDIVEAARIDGSGEFRTFLTIAIPMMKPAIAVQAIFAFIASWNNYYTPSMILLSSKFKQKTLPMMISGIQASDKFKDYGAIYMALALAIVPIVIVYILLSKFIIAGVALGGVKE